MDFLVVMTFGRAGMIHPSLAAMVDAIKGKISRVAMHQRFTKAAVSFLEKCLCFILKQKVHSMACLQTKLLDRFVRVLLFDSSSWDVSPKLKNILPGCGGSASGANCKIQTCYEYRRGELSFFDMMAGTKSDNAYTAHLPDYIQTKDLILFDLGYFCLNTFLGIIRKGAFFLSRFLIGTSLFHAETGLPLVLEKMLTKVQNNIFEIPVILGAEKEKQFPCRLICLRVSEQVANQHRRRLKKEAQKKGRTPSQKHLILADWILMITNVPQEWLPTQMVRPLYSLRWQIELLFKQIKSVLQIHHSNTGKENRLRCEIYGKLIVAILFHRIHAILNISLWNEQGKELSMEKLYKRIQERSFLIADLLLCSVSMTVSYLKKEVPKLIKNCIKSYQISRKSTLQIVEFGIPYSGGVLSMVA